MVNLVSFLGNWQIQWIIILITIDVVLGISGALVKKEFRLGKIANFMIKPVLGYIFGFTVLNGLSQMFPGLTLVVKGVFYLIIFALIGSILTNLGRLGLPIPDYLKK